MRRGDNQYGPPAGIEQLRSALALLLPGSPDPTDELTITAGATEALNAVMLALLEPGDEVVLTEPYYPNFLAAAALAGGRPRFVPLRPPHWSLDPDDVADAIGPRTRLLLLNTPHNPTGRLLSRDELQLLGSLCARRGIWLVSDEVYASYAYEGLVHTSVCDLPGLHDLAISIGSLSKSHAVSGWRMGYVRAARPVTRAVRRVHEALTAGGATPLQHGLAAVLAGTEGARLASAMQERRDRALEMFRLSGLACTTPQGGCYFTVALPDAFGSSEAFAGHLLRRAGIAVLPGSLFVTGSDPALGGFVRVAFNRRRKTLNRALDRLNGFGVTDRLPSVESSEGSPEGAA